MHTDLMNSVYALSVPTVPALDEKIMKILPPGNFGKSYPLNAWREAPPPFSREHD